MRNDRALTPSRIENGDFGADDGTRSLAGALKAVKGFVEKAGIAMGRCESEMTVFVKAPKFEASDTRTKNNMSLVVDAGILQSYYLRETQLLK